MKSMDPLRAPGEIKQRIPARMSFRPGDHSQILTLNSVPRDSAAVGCTDAARTIYPLTKKLSWNSEKRQHRCAPSHQSRNRPAAVTVAAAILVVKSKVQTRKRCHAPKMACTRKSKRSHNNGKNLTIGTLFDPHQRLHLILSLCGSKRLLIRTFGRVKKRSTTRDTEFLQAGVIHCRYRLLRKNQRPQRVNRHPRCLAILRRTQWPHHHHRLLLLHLPQAYPDSNCHPVARLQRVASLCGSINHFPISRSGSNQRSM